MCDTLVALPPDTAGGSVVFGKNSDRPRNERQVIRHYPAARHPPGATLRCTYIEIPEAERTYAVLLSQPDWMWGAEMGANDKGVVIGNEAVATREELGPPALLGMDLLRLGLERGGSAADALEAIARLLEEFGQGGACAENDPSFSYHNSFLIADAAEAWVVETAGGYWAAEKITAGSRNISNNLTIRDNYDKACRDLGSAEGRVDFAATFSAGPADAEANSRQGWGTRLLAERRGAMTPGIMIGILSDHESGICMHGEFETTASMVSELYSDRPPRHWLTGAPHPCSSPFKEIGFPG